MTIKVDLRRVPFPELPESGERPPIGAEEYERRLVEIYAAAGADWVIVYGDREHSANLAFACGFDPRFEEALLVLGPAGRRVLIVGNEGVDYVPAAAGLLVQVALCQSLSLMGQPRSRAPRLADVLRAIGIAEGARMALIGWKYLEAEETDDPTAPAFVPALLADTARQICGAGGRVFDGTAVLMHPAHGLKARNGAAQIAAYAWAAERAANAVLRVVRGARPGMSEYEVAGLMGYQGDPLACHVMMTGGAGPVVGLRSPSARRLAEGDGVTTAIGLWGSLSCRAGVLSATPEADFVERYVGPYFGALATWWQSLRIGVEGGAIHAAVLGALAGAPFAPALNPGHLIALDEWTHTPIRAGSADRIASGMVLQCDIIPSPLPAGRALNCEDTVAVADAALRAELQAGYPELWGRIEARRGWMREALGIALPEELLPLSTAPAYLPPFWMASELVCVAEA
jgi:hypothetical protein